MSTRRFHLAQINVARMRAILEDPIMADFVAKLPEINALADGSPGFVWRMQTEDGDATAIRAGDDPLLLVNMSVWESVDALHEFTYRSHHARAMRDRSKWFEKPKGPYYAMWWVPIGHRPTLEEGLERLRLLAEGGPTDRAFWFGAQADPPLGPRDDDEPIV